MKREIIFSVALVVAVWVALGIAANGSLDPPSRRASARPAAAPLALPVVREAPTGGRTASLAPTISTTVFLAVADAYVDSASPGANSGVSNTLNVGLVSPGQTGRALLRFDTSSLDGATVQAASLELHRNTGSTSPPALDAGLYRITQAWAETSANWNNQPAAVTSNKVNPLGIGAAYYQWDVGDLVQGWANGTYPNYGILLRADPETQTGWRGFNSRENSLNPPRLVITYTASISTSDPQVQGLRRLQANSTETVRARFRNGVPRFVHARVPTGGTASDPLSQARAYLNAYKDLYRITDATSQFRLEGHSADRYGSHLAFQQVHNGVPVFGSDVRIHITNTVLSSASAAYVPELSLSTVPSATMGVAERVAITDVLSSTPGITVTVVGQTSLVVFDRSIWANVPPDPRLAWQVNVRGEGDWSYFVDAQNGAVLGRISRDADDRDLELFDARNQRGSWCWNNPLDDPSILLYDESGWVSDRFAPEPDEENAYNYIRQVYDFYRELGQRSYDDEDTQIEMFMNVLFPASIRPNAMWRSCGDLIEFSPGWAVQDVAGHEFTHGVTQYSAELVYEDEPGALNESFSDIFGEFIEWYATGTADWLNGTNLPGGAIRSLANPPIFTTQLGNPFPDTYANYVQTNMDSGGVHINSSIGNKAAWLISQCGLSGVNIFNGVTVTGICIPDAQRIFFDALAGHPTDVVEGRGLGVRFTREVGHLGPSSTYTDTREGMIEAATELFGNATPQACAVRNAYAAVGIGDRDTDCDGAEDPADRDDDNDEVLDAGDNCSLVANPNQLNTDGDGRGNACDNDDDNDLSVDQFDNCTKVANGSQRDDDGDGIGEACDDDDRDGVPNLRGDDSAYDNCPQTANPDQGDFDRDGIGDVCDTDSDADGILDDGDGSGTKGDGYCTGGATTNCDDNAPLFPNPKQTDDDGDGVGDEVDNCPNTPNPWSRAFWPPVQADSDGDGVGDACDDDDDNDNVPDGADNCQFKSNKDQFNFDRNGPGSACDPDEAAMFSGGPRDIFVRFESPETPAKLPLFPCLADGCPELNSAFPDGQRGVVSLGLTKGFGARITDETGGSVKRDRSGALYKSLSFPVHPSYRMDLGSMAYMGTRGSARSATGVVTDTVSYAQRPLYYLELFPTSDTVMGQYYTVTFNLASFRPSTGIALPLLLKNYSQGFDTPMPAPTPTSTPVPSPTATATPVPPTPTPTVTAGNVITLTPVADTYVYSGTLTTNYGGNSSVLVGRLVDTNVSRALFRFDLSSIPEGATVQSASFKAYLMEAGVTPGLLDWELQRIDASAPWQETTVTWATQPVYLSSNNVISIGSQAGYYSWDVTNLVQAWRTEGAASNNGVALTKKVETSLGVRKFASRESGNKPQLVINFQP